MNEYPWNQKSQPEPKEDKEARKEEPFSLDPKDPAAPSGEAEESPAAEPEKGSSGQTEESQPKPEPDGSCGETSQGEEQEDARRNPTVPDAQEAQEDAQVRQPQEEKQPEETAADAQPEGETKETQSQNGSQQPGDSGGEHTAPEPPIWGQGPGGGWETPPGQPPYGYPPYGGYPPPPYAGGEGQPPYQDPYYGSYPPPQPPWYDSAGYSDYVPYNGQPPQPMNKGMKAFIGIMIGLAAVFVLGFLVWGIAFSVNRQYAPEIPERFFPPVRLRGGRIPIPLREIILGKRQEIIGWEQGRIRTLLELRFIRRRNRKWSRRTFIERWSQRLWALWQKLPNPARREFPWLPA